MRNRHFLLLLGVLAAAGCGGDVTTGNPVSASPTPTPSGTSTPIPTTPGGTPTPSPTGTPAGACASGFTWVLGDLGSSWMHPGRDCLSCHTSGGAAGNRIFLLAGTVYASANQPDECGGVANVTVNITDANGATYTQTSGFDGNFYLQPSDAPAFAPPYKISLSANGNTRAMNTAQSAGGCDSCHTQTGANGAPGRILSP